MPLGIVGNTIQPGDRLVMGMKQTIKGAGGATFGGVTLFHSTLSSPDFNCTCGATDTATGRMLFGNTLTDGAWHHFSADLSANGYAGFVVTSLEAGIHNQTAQGTWDVYLANVAILRADGSVVQLYEGQGSSVGTVSGWGLGGSHDMTSATEAIPTGGDPEVANTYYVADHLGSAQMEFSASGAPLSSSQFMPFGGEINPAVTSNRYKFTGKERDAESGLDYFGARYYASNMGRFMSPDWAAKAEPVPYAKLDDPQSLNLYAYVGNNPLSRSDIDGHCYQGAGGNAACATRGIGGPPPGGPPKINLPPGKSGKPNGWRTSPDNPGGSRVKWSPSEPVPGGKMGRNQVPAGIQRAIGGA